MKYLPAEDITFKTKLKEATLVQRLEDSIEPVKAFRFGLFQRRETKPYQGKVVGSPSQYSEAFVDWIVERVKHDPQFFVKARETSKKSGKK